MTGTVRKNRGLRRSVGIALTMSTVLLGSSASAATVSAQPGDHTVTNGPISITVPVSATVQRGSTATLDDFCGLGPPVVWTVATATVAWSAHTSTGTIMNYDIYQNTSETGPQLWKTVTVPKLTDLISNYDGSCGGGSANDGWTIVARDTSGHTVSATVHGYLSVDRWNNYNVDFLPVGTWTYSGQWATSTCLCADGGTQTYATTVNASATYTMHATLGRHFALMMAKGPTRGSFALYQDGALKATISTYTTANTNRVIVWTSRALTAGTHVFKIVNLATAGHSRIDVNAALTD